MSDTKPETGKPKEGIAVYYCPFKNGYFDGKCAYIVMGKIKKCGWIMKHKSNKCNQEFGLIPIEDRTL